MRDARTVEQILNEWEENDHSLAEGAAEAVTIQAL